MVKQNENLANDLRLEQDKYFHVQKLYDELLLDDEKKEYQEEIQRLKRDLGLELYRKQDTEKKARLFEDKFHQEQTLNQKNQYDLMKIKHDFKTLQVKYDALQLEMIDLHQTTKENPGSEIRMVDDRTSATTIQEDPHIQLKTEKADSPIYATIQRKKTSTDEVSFTTVAVPSPTVDIPTKSNETPKASTFKRIQSFFRVTPSRN